MASEGETDTDILSGKIIEALCSMCKYEDKQTEGVKFCVECDDYFCGQCVSIHNKVPSCVRHKLLDKAQVNTGVSEGLQRAPAERCDRHSHKHIDMYCENHDKVGCSTCMVVDHKLCEDTFYIPDYLQNNTDKVATEEIQTELESIAETLKEQTDQYKEIKQSLQQRKEELLTDIKKFRQEINDQLDKLEKNSIDEIEGKLKILEGKIDEGLKQLQEIEEKVASALSKLTSPNINQTEVFVNVKTGKDIAEVAETNIEESKMKIKLVEGIQLYPNQAVITKIEKNESLGVTHSLLQINTGLLYDVNIESDEKSCYIISACCTEDGTIILADNNNKKLKRLDCNDYTVMDYYELPGHPWQVCSIDSSQVAVSFQLDEVHFISLEEEMETTSTIETGFLCFGLAYANDNLYISDSDTSVYLYTLSGEKLRQFSMDQSGHSLFSDIYSLAVNKDVSRIYVADYKNGLVVLDNDGQVVSTYDDEMLQGARCCNFTDDGTVLVSGWYSENVVQFTSDGDLIGEVLTAEGITLVQTVGCSQLAPGLFISRNGDTENEIELYEFESVK